MPDHSVVLIFDDGFEDFFSVASKELIRRQLPATVFVITEGAYGRFPAKGESFLSWPEIQTLASAGMQIGSHTCSHPNLVNLPLDKVRKELSDSYAAVANNVTQPEVPLSYPYGQTSDEVRMLAQSLGYSCGITGTLGPNGDKANLYALNRTVIASDDDPVTFAARVSGLTWWADRVRRLRRRPWIDRRDWNEELASHLPLMG